MTLEHEEYQKSHRMPRVLVVANGKTEDPKDISFTLISLVMNLDCLCLRFVAKGSDNVHVLIPGKHEKAQMESIRDVFDQSVKEGRPYDLIMVDSEACGKEIIRLAGKLEPKPGVILYMPERYSPDAERLRKSGIPAFDLGEVVMNPVFDAQVERALGVEGIKRLECQSGQDSAFQQWLDSETRYREVAPSGAIRKPTHSAGDSLPGHG